MNKGAQGAALSTAARHTGLFGDLDALSGGRIIRMHPDSKNSSVRQYFPPSRLSV